MCIGLLIRIVYFETLVVLLSGSVTIEGIELTRDDPFVELASGVFLPPRSEIEIRGMAQSQLVVARVAIDSVYSGEIHIFQH